MTRPGRVLILGAGPTGLGAAWRLSELGHRDWLICESGDRPGGLARSFTDEAGFTWDVGGHIVHSHYRYFDHAVARALGPDGQIEHERQTSIRMRGRFVPYPFQNNLRHLPKADLWRCLDGLLALRERAPAGPPRDFREWVLETFGAGIAELFMLPYNEKVWAWPPETLGYGWIGDRVAVTDLRRVLERVILEQDDTVWGPNSRFAFPRSGGTGAIWEGVAGLVGRERIRFGRRLKQVELAAKECRFEDGSVEPYDALLSTIPLDQLADAAIDLPGETADLARGLRHSSSHIVGVGLRGEPPASARITGWIYFPEPEVPFYRASVYSAYSPENVPDPRRFWSLLAETSESAHRPLDRARVADRTVEGLLASGMIESRAQVASVWHHRVEYGYPTPSLERDGILARVLPELERRGVSSRGRFGGWKYEVSNQDHCFMQGVEWVGRLWHGYPELTYFHPHVVNANVYR